MLPLPQPPFSAWGIVAVGFLLIPSRYSAFGFRQRFAFGLYNYLSRVYKGVWGAGLDLLIGELLAEVGHHVAQLRRRDEPVAVLVEHLMCIRGLSESTVAAS